MIYFAKISKEKEGGYFVEFPELPGCLTEGDTIQEAKENAKEALDGWLYVHFDRNLSVPVAVKRKSRNFYPIEVDIQIAFAIKLRSLRLNSKLSQSQAASKLGVSQQAYSKLESPEKTNPSLKTIKRLSEAFSVDLLKVAL